MRSYPQKFYNRPTLKVAQDLLGSILIHKKYQGIITEVEAYVGQDDLACHASKGRTPRTEVMFGPPGHWYVYLVYGMYHCLNVVTEEKDFPAAVLIRGVQPLSSNLVGKDCAGPGKLCRHLGITKKLNNTKAYGPTSLRIVPHQKVSPRIIKKSPRIGVDYAKHCKAYPWRFSIYSK